MVAGGRDGVLHVLETATGKVVTEWTGGAGKGDMTSEGKEGGGGRGTSGATCLYCDKYMVASAGLDGRVRVWYNRNGVQ